MAWWDALKKLSVHTQHEIATDAWARVVEPSPKPGDVNGTTEGGIVPKGILGPLFTDYTGRVGVDYYVSSALRPSLTVGFGNFHTESSLPLQLADGSYQSAGRTIATGTQFILEAGMLLNEAAAFGDNDNYFGFLGGPHQVGLGLTVYSFAQEGVPSLVKISVINRQPLIHTRIPTPEGVAIAGLSLFPGDTGFVISDSRVPGCPPEVQGSSCDLDQVIPVANTGVVSFNLDLEPGGTNSRVILQKNAGRLYRGELIPRLSDFATRRLERFISIQNVPRYANIRSLLEVPLQGSLESKNSSSLVRTGLDVAFIGTAYSEGKHAADVGLTVRRATLLEEKLALIGEEVGTVGALWTGCALSPDYTKNKDILEGRFGAMVDFAGRGACILAPVATEATVLGIADGFNLTGDPHDSPVLFWTTHGVAAAIGLYGLVDYILPAIVSETDPDSEAYSGGTGEVITLVPSKQIKKIEGRFTKGALLTVPLSWALFSYLNRRLPLDLSITPTGAGGVVLGAAGTFD